MADRQQFRERVLAERGFRKDPRDESWFNLKTRKSLSYEAVRDYNEMSWRAAASNTVVPDGEFWFYSLDPLATRVCEQQLARWNLERLHAVIKAQTAPGQPLTVLTIDDPQYWQSLTTEEVIAKMERVQVDSPIWKRADGELKIRQLREASQQRSEGESDHSQTVASPAVSFECIKSKPLRQIAERDWRECWIAFNAGCWKSVLILSGGILEAIVLSKLSRRRSKALKAKAAAGGKPELDSWTLGKMIAVGKELELFGPSIDMLPSPMKDYRNLAHPGHEIRGRLSISENSARASLNVLTLILEELERVS